jgi:hypothetical protein
MGKERIFNELTNEQRRRLIDIQQKAESLRYDASRLRHEFAGSMAWRTRGGQDYLYRRQGRVEKSLGRRSSETEAIFATFRRRKNILLERQRGIGDVLRGWSPVTRALRLGRVPLPIARLLRHLDASDLLDGQIQIAGGCALIAYEAITGLVFDKELVGPMKGLEIVTQVHPKILLAHLRGIDASFSAVGSSNTEFQSATGILVEIVGSSADDSPRGINAIGADGMPVWIAVVQPPQYLSLLRHEPSPRLLETISYMVKDFWHEPSDP